MHIASNKFASMLMTPVVYAIKLLGHYNPIFLVKIRYYFRFKKRLDLTNPKTLNEKILWQSLKTDTSLRTRLADKWLVRKYVEDCGLSDILVELYGVWDNASKIDFDTLPVSFVLKPNNGSGNIILINDKSKIDKNAIINSINHDLNQIYGELEGGRHYYGIKPVVIAEEMLINDPVSAKYSSSIIDYKIWCFNGKAYYIWTCSNRCEETTEVMTYDREWNSHPEYSIFNKFYSEAALLPKPKFLERMLEISEILAKPFPVVRVDLYNLNGRICFGEMTFTSLGGLMNFYTDEFQKQAGDLIDLSYGQNKY